MNVENQATGNLADRIGEKLSPVHRGAIWIGEETIAVFGNDGYRAEGVAEIAAKMRHWLAYKGTNPSEVITCEDLYTWVIIANCSGAGMDRERVDRKLWRLWSENPNKGRTSLQAGRFQRSLARSELEAIGGGYHDDALEKPLQGKGGRVRGDRVMSQVILRQVSGNEDVHVLLGGVPFPAKILPSSIAQDQPFEVEAVVLTGDVGDPRSEADGTASAFIPAGSPICVRDFKERHDVTGLRVLVPVNPTTGEPLPE